MAEIVRFLPLDEHLCKAHSIGNSIIFLPEELNLRRGIKVADIVVSRGQHTAGTTCLVANGDNLVVIENIVTALGQQKRDTQLNDVTARVVLTGFHVLEESTDEILEDVAHADGIEASPDSGPAPRRLSPRNTDSRLYPSC